MDQTTIIKYDKSIGDYIGNVSSKVRKLLKLNLISRVSQDTYLCGFIPGYNKSTYFIKEHSNHYTCDCQANKIHGRECSHIKAVRLYKIQGRESQ